MDFTTEIVNRAIKYLIEGLFVAIAAIFVPKKSLPVEEIMTCLLYTSPSPRDRQKSRMPSSA